MRLYSLRYIITIFLLAGCASNRPVDQAATERFGSAVKSWTASGKIYREMELLLSASATRLTPEFRAAYVEKYAQDHYLSAEEKEKLASREKKKTDDMVEFIVCLYSDHKSWNNLADKDSIWTVVLTDKEGHTLKPTKIDRLDPVPVYVTDLFPTMSHWKRVYSVVFTKKPAGPKTPSAEGDARDHSLDFRSAIGHLSLAF